MERYQAADENDMGMDSLIQDLAVPDQWSLCQYLKWRLAALIAKTCRHQARIQENFKKVVISDRLVAPKCMAGSG